MADSPFLFFFVRVSLTAGLAEELASCCCWCVFILTSSLCDCDIYELIDLDWCSHETKSFDNPLSLKVTKLKKNVVNIYLLNTIETG